MPFTRNEAETLLVKKFGFEWKRGSGRNPHDRLVLVHNGKQVASTAFSRNLRPNQDIEDWLMTPIVRELRAQTNSTLKGMFNCTVGRDKYLEILKSQGFLP